MPAARCLTSPTCRVPVLSDCSAKKASPTVSISRTNVTHVNTIGLLPSPSGLPDTPTQSFIPFPSSPIPCPAGRDGDREFDLHEVDDENLIPQELDATKEQSGPTPVLANWHAIRRRCSRSCLAASYFHRDSGVGPALAPRRPLRSMQNRSSRPSNDSTLSRTQPETKSQGAPVRKSSMSSKSLSPKRMRKGRKLTTDVQFLALVHRSIAWTIRQEDSHNVYVAQDVALAKRLWQTLVTQGLKPVMFDAGDDTASNPNEGSNVSESQSKPPLTSAVMPASTSLSTSPPSNPVSPSHPQVLSIPQLVASLTLRFRERCGSRPRPSGAVNMPNKNVNATDKFLVAAGQRPSSSLAHVIFSVSDADPE